MSEEKKELNKLSLANAIRRRRRKKKQIRGEKVKLSVMTSM